jgi:hypothetical protein
MNESFLARREAYRGPDAEPLPAGPDGSGRVGATIAIAMTVGALLGAAVVVLWH